MQLIPVTVEADQRFSVTMVGQRVSLRLRYNTLIDRWSVSVSIDDEPLLDGRRMTLNRNAFVGVLDNLGSLFLYSETVVDPNFDNVSDGTVKLYHADPDEV